MPKNEQSTKTSTDQDNILLNSISSDVKEMAKQMCNLVAIEAGRVEREKSQQAVNEEIKAFIKEYTSTLNTSRKIHGAFGKWWDKVLFMITVGIASYFGFDWKK